MRVLVVEDEPSAARDLQQLIEALEPLAIVDHQNTFDGAKTAIETVRYDLIFCDLLLLPPSMELKGARVVDRSDPTVSRRFGQKLWNQFVQDEGGVELVRQIRKLSGDSKNRQTPIAVTTFFIELPGFRHIVRRLSGDGDPQMVFIPKVTGVRAVADKLGRRFKGLQGDLNESLEATFASVLEAAKSNRALSTVEAQASELRDLSNLASRELAARGGATSRYSVLGTLVPKTCDLLVTVDPTGDLKTATELYRSDQNDFYRFRGLYEDWLSLRDYVLLNPMISVALTLEVRSMEHPERKLTEVVLDELSPPPLWLSSDGRVEEQTARRLISRLMLVYLANQSEPMDDGWAIAEEALSQIGSNPEHWIESLPQRDLLPEIRDDSWGVDFALRLSELAAGTGVRDGFLHLKGLLEKKLDGIVDCDEVLVTPPPSKRAYYFNGDLELGVAESNWYDPPPELDQRVAFFPLKETVLFACHEGRYMATAELEQRFRDAKIPVTTFDRIEDSDIVSREMPDATMALLAPVDETLLKDFLDGELGREWAANPPAPQTLLVLESEVSKDWPQEQLDWGREHRIECMFPSPDPGALDLTKMMDHVICSGFRVRYREKHLREDDPAARAACRDALSDIFDAVFEMGYAGDAMSGSASIRTPDGRIFVTSSKTLKRSRDPDDVAIVHSVDFVRNVVEWSGRRRPSSSILWQYMLYERMPEMTHILHTHWKDFTYSRVAGIDQHRTPEYALSGSQTEAADLVLKLLDERCKQFAILKDHGEVFVGRGKEDLLATVNWARGMYLDG